MKQECNFCHTSQYLTGYGGETRQWKGKKCPDCLADYMREYNGQNNIRGRKFIANKSKETSNTKQCSICHEYLYLSDYHASGTGRKGVQSACKKCNSLRNRARIHGITVQEWNEMWSKQGETCAMCQQEIIDERKRHTDHDHETRKIRGILCQRCNVGLGYIEDANWLANAKNYLLQHGKEV